MLVPGAAIEIKGGYASSETTLFAGVITRQRIEAPDRGDTRLHVEARGAVFRMSLARVSRVFTDVTDADVIETLVGAYANYWFDYRVAAQAARHGQAKPLEPRPRALRAIQNLDTFAPQK